MSPGEDPSQALVIDAITAATRGADPAPEGVVGVNSFDIFERTVQHIGSSEADVGGLNNHMARESMARLLEGQIGQVHDTFGGADNANFATDTDSALNRVIGDIGHSPEAYASLANAERAYTVSEMQHAVQHDRADILVNETKKLGSFLGQLDQGRVIALDQEWQGKEDTYNERVESVGLLGELAVDKALGAIPVASTAAKSLVGDLVESAKVDYTDEATAERTNVYDNSRADLKTLARDYSWEHQLYENKTGASVPPQLIQDGEPVPIGEMNNTQRKIFQEWSEINTDIGPMAGEIQDAYNLAYAEAKQSQAGGY